MKTYEIIQRRRNIHSLAVALLLPLAAPLLLAAFLTPRLVCLTIYLVSWSFSQLFKL